MLHQFQISVFFFLSFFDVFESESKGDPHMAFC